MIFKSYRRISVACSIKILMEDIWKFSRDQNIYNCHHIYRETNRITDCLAKKDIDNIDLRTRWLNFSKNVTNISIKDYCRSSFNCFCKITTL